MIDLHSHILPGFDDGAADISESLVIARKYIEAGFHTVVATPHFVPGTAWKPSPDKIRTAVDTLNKLLEKDGIGLKVIPGMEIALDPAISSLVKQRLLLTLNDSGYLLVELPFQQVPFGWKELLLKLQLQGLHILIAHPERCAHLINNPHIAEELVDAGFYLQVNWGSLAGMNGKASRQTAFKFAAMGLIHCLAVDSHNGQSRNAAVVKNNLESVSHTLGNTNIELLCKNNPEKVLRGDSLEKMQPVEYRSVRTKRVWWRPWAKR